MEEKLYFNSEDGLKLCGILSKPDVPTPRCVVLGHGLTGIGKEGEIYEELARELAARGLASFRFDFRGHGESEGRPDQITLTGEKKDFAAVFAFIKSWGFKNFGIVAASFSAGPASIFLRENPGVAKSMVFLNPIFDYSWLFESSALWPKSNFGREALAKLQKQGWIEIGKYKLKIGRQFIDEMKWLQPLQSAQNLSIPSLFIYGDGDEIVPQERLASYPQAFKNSRVEIIAGAEHGFHNSREAAQKACNLAADFLAANS